MVETGFFARMNSIPKYSERSFVEASHVAITWSSIRRTAMGGRIQHENLRSEISDEGNNSAQVRPLCGHEITDPSCHATSDLPEQQNGPRNKMPILCPGTKAANSFKAISSKVRRGLVLEWLWVLCGAQFDRSWYRTNYSRTTNDSERF
jgi:hypothetical protein